jgi:hypothetical protein
MSRTQKKTPNPEKYAGKEFLTYDESTDFLGISLSTLTRYINDEGIETKKFYRDKKRYLTIEDVRRIEKLIQAPWERVAPIHNEPEEKQGKPKPTAA